MHVNVIDEPMGSGKTSAAINFINQSDSNHPFLVITPYLKQVERYKKSCRAKDFKSPTWENGTKLNNIKTLIGSRENIVSTHALFQRFDQEVIDMLSISGYTLILDEVADVVSILELTKQDQKYLMKEFLTKDPDTGLVTWNEDAVDYDGRYSDIKNMCYLNSLAFYSDDSDVVIWLFPIQVFNAFEEVYILTYMFDAQIQRYYYDYHGLKYSYMYVVGDSPDNYAFTKEKQPRDTDYSDLITIIENKKLNEIGIGQYTLSKSWYEKARNTDFMKDLKANVYNYFRNYAKGKTDKNLWTTFKDYKNVLSGNGYTKGFLELNARASNEYKERTNVAYLVNVFMNPVIHHFFSIHGVEVDQDGYALSEMLQFIWRSAIREHNPITVYVPSLRMRRLLKNWIEDNMLRSGKIE